MLKNIHHRHRSPYPRMYHNRLPSIVIVVAQRALFLRWAVLCWGNTYPLAQRSGTGHPVHPTRPQTVSPVCQIDGLLVESPALEKKSGNVHASALNAQSRQEKLVVVSTPIHPLPLSISQLFFLFHSKPLIVSLSLRRIPAFTTRNKKHALSRSNRYHALARRR